MASRRGLGRGLGAILPDQPDPTFPIERAADTFDDRVEVPSLGALQEQLAGAVLGAFDAALPIDFAFHLLVGDDDSVVAQHLTALSGLDCASDHYRISAAADQVLRHGGVHEIDVLGRHCVAVATHGPTSRAVWIVGRRSKSLKARHRRLFLRLARTLGDVTHQLHTDMVAPPPRVVSNIRVALTDPGAHASVTMRTRSGLHEGSAHEPTVVDAVARASVAALDAGVQVEDLVQVSCGSQRAMLTLVESADGDLGLGIALTTDETFAAAATAVHRATTALQPDLVALPA